MKKNVIAAIGCLMISSAAFSQTGWLPIVNLSGANLCDPSPLQLVFSDDFDGTTLNPAWNTYLSWPGIYVVRGNDTVQPYPSHQWWSDSRIDPGPSILKDENVIVSNGTCKLMLYADPHASISYHDSTKQGNPLVTVNADYSSSIITLPSTTSTWGNGTYNSGKFEARIKFPTLDGAWCAFWLWYGTSVDEVDMAEAWGGNASINNFFQNKKHTNYAMHAWAPNPNPLGLPSPEVNITEHYPNQSTWNYITGNYFHQDNWHTYSYDWDTASIAVYLDGSQINKIYKYSRRGMYMYTNIINGVHINVAYPVTIGSSCNPFPGTYSVTYGYPYNNASLSGLRLETKWASHQDYIKNLNITTKTALADMEVDYVRVWQRHPELEGHQSICADNTYPSTPIIDGPNEICGAIDYTLNPPVSGGFWDASSDIALFNGSSTGVNAAKNAGAGFNNGYISYSYGNGNSACPLMKVYKSGLYCNHSTPWEVNQVFSYNNIGNGTIHFITEQYIKTDVLYNTTPTVRWNVSVNLGQDSYDARTAVNYTMFGEYASTPSFAIKQGTPYYVRWTMSAYNGPDTIIRTGERNSASPSFQQPKDPYTWYYNAYVDDQDTYEAAVMAEVPKHMVSEEEFASDMFTGELIEKAKEEALIPYVNFGGVNQSMSKSGRTNTAFDLETRVYPNPVQSNLNIAIGNKFSDQLTVEITLYDLVGKRAKYGSFAYQKGNFLQYNLSDIPEGNYILELLQNEVKEHVKITKSK